MAKAVLGIIGGSGLSDLFNQEEKWKTVQTPWGAPSDALYIDEQDGLKYVFLPRHGRGHVHLPSTVNYRANIAALKAEGVTDIISLSAVGSLNEELPPGMFVLPYQYIDRTYKRENTFFESGLVAHVPFALPVSPNLQQLVAAFLRQCSILHSVGGCLITIEGPQFSSSAESLLHKSWGAGLVGMTAMPEAKLAREAEMKYCTIAMVTDFDVWHPEHEAVDVGQVLRTMEGNSKKARDFIALTLKSFPREYEPCVAGSHHALDGAIMTAPEKRDQALIEKLRVIAGRVL